MRATHYLFGILLVAGSGALQTQAAEPAHARPAAACNATQRQAGEACMAIKRVRADVRQVQVQNAKASLDLAVCNRLQSQVERDTCLNRVEATA